MSSGKRPAAAAPRSFDYEDDDQDEDHNFELDLDEDEDYDESALLGTPVAGTRLNFNNALLGCPSTLNSHQSSSTASPLRHFVVHGGADDDRDEDGKKYHILNEPGAFVDWSYFFFQNKSSMLCLLLHLSFDKSCIRKQSRHTNH